jgi:WD40 repeat protein
MTLWDVRDRRMITEQPAGPGPKALGFSPQSDLLAWGSRDQDGRPGLNLWHADPPRPIAWLPSLRHSRVGGLFARCLCLAALAEDGRIRVWETATQRVLQDLWGDKVSAGSPIVGCIRFSPDGRMLVAGGDAPRIQRWDWATGVAATFDPVGEVGRLRTQPGLALPTASCWRRGPVTWTIKCISLTSKRAPSAGSADMRSWIADLVFSADGRTLATASGDQTIRLWDVHTGTELRRLQGHQNEVYCLARSPVPGHRQIVSGGKDGSVRVWDLAAPSVVRSYVKLPVDNLPLGLTFCPDGQRFLTASYLGGLAVVWDARSIEQVERLDWVGSGSARFAFLPDRGLLVVGYELEKIQVWDQDTRSTVADLVLPGASIGELALSRSGRTLVALGHRVGTGRVLKLWETSRWREMDLPGVDLTDLVSASLAPDERTLAVSYHGGSVKWWDLTTQRPIASYDWQHLGPELVIAFSPDGRFFAAGGEPGTMILVNLDTREQRTVARGHLTRISSLAFSPDGERLLTAGTEAADLVKIWDPVNGQELATLAGISGFSEHLGFSPDGSVLFAASDSGLALLWRAPSWEEIEQGKTLRRNIEPPTQLATPPAAARLDSADGLVYRESFDAHPHWAERGRVQGGGMLVTNGYAVLRSVLDQPTDPARPDYSWSAYLPVGLGSGREFWQVTFQPGRTVELRIDWIEANQDDAFAAICVDRRINGYEVLLDRNEILLIKYGATPTVFNACFFWEQLALPETNRTLSAAFTPVGQDLKIRVQIRDRTRQIVLWEKEVIDTAGLDPVLPDAAVKRLLLQPEGTPAPYIGIPLLPFLGLGYGNPDHPPIGTVEVIVDNFEVRDFETPVEGE